MHLATFHLRRTLWAAILAVSALAAQQPQVGPPRIEGKLDEALAAYQRELQSTPDSPSANLGAGIVLDLMGRGPEARKYFARGINTAPNPSDKADAQRGMAMSYGFEGDCTNTLKYERKVIDYYVSVNDFYHQGEMADEGARVCLEAGHLAAAEKWYKMGHDAGMREPNLPPDRKDIWEFRWEHASARIAVRRGNRAEAQKHVAAAKAVLDRGSKMRPPQEPWFHYLVGYVAFYSGDNQTALAELRKANQKDPFILCLLGQTHEKLGEKAKAHEFYMKAHAAIKEHTPPAAYAHRYLKQKYGDFGAHGK